VEERHIFVRLQGQQGTPCLDHCLSKRKNQTDEMTMGQYIDAIDLRIKESVAFTRPTIIGMSYTLQQFQTPCWTVVEILLPKP
jgi:hypothetical protein